MEYQITIGDRHSFVVSPSKSEPDRFILSEIDIDLSSSNLFMDPERSPDRTGAEHALVPLSPQAREVFESIERLKDSSPLVDALKQFKELRLVTLLNHIQQPAFRDPIAIEKLKDHHYHTQISKALQEAIAQIDRELPHFFSTEKEIGTFAWMSSGCDNKLLGSSLDSVRPFDGSKVQPGDCLYLDRSGNFVLYDVNTKTAHVLEDQQPSASTIFEALCLSGSLGRSVVEVNKAAMLHPLVTPAIEFVAASQYGEKVIKKLLTKGPGSLPSTLLWAELPFVVVGTIISAPMVAHVLDNAVTKLDLVRAGLLTGLSAISILVWRSTCRIHAWSTSIFKKGSALLDENGKLPKSTRVEAINTFATALLDEVASGSGGGTEILLGPKSLQHWQQALPEVFYPDHTLMPKKIVPFAGGKLSLPSEDIEPMTLSLDSRDDFSGRELTDDALEEIAGEFANKTEQIERAFETWNMIHASRVVQEFVARQGIESERMPRIDLMEKLKQAPSADTDESLTYPEASELFTATTRHFKLNRATWNLVSRGLVAANQLERINDSQRAQAIAQEVFARHFLDK